MSTFRLDSAQICFVLSQIFCRQYTAVLRALSNSVRWMLQAFSNSMSKLTPSRHVNA